MDDQELYLGRALDGTEAVHLDMDHLTTHAVCVGMTGSGKTGLGIVALEELGPARGVAAGHRPQGRHGRPDAQLSRRFHGADFEPWLPPDAAEGVGRRGGSRCPGRDVGEGARRLRARAGRHAGGEKRRDMAADHSGRRFRRTARHSPRARRARGVGSFGRSGRRHRSRQRRDLGPAVAGRARAAIRCPIATTC